MSLNDLPLVGVPMNFARRRAGRLAAHDDVIAGYQNLLDLPFQIRNGLEPRSDPGDDLLPGIAEIIAAAGHPLRRGRLPDEFRSVLDDCGIEGVVERA